MNPPKKHLLLENLLRTLLRSVLLHDPIGVHPKKHSKETYFVPPVRHLASSSVTFVLSFFGGSPLHDGEGIPLPTRGFRGALQKNDTCLGLVLLCMGSLDKCHLRAGAKGGSEGLPGAHKIAWPKGHFESDTWTR